MPDLVIKVPEKLLSKYATAAPRYTSYPTAVDWQNNVPPAEYADELGRCAAADGACAVYIHMPFCESLCLFCGCNVVITHDRSRSEGYLDLLIREIESVGDSGIGKRPVTQYHWGGGTPTYLDVDQMKRVQEAFSRVFTLAPDCEAAVEVDPRVTSREQLQYLGSVGFNRLSLGIQDFDPEVQKAIKRVQSVAATREVVEHGREAGFESVNVDLIYGLPKQTLSGFLSTVGIVLEQIRPERVALFHYAHVPWLKKHQQAMDLNAAPDPRQKMQIFTRTVEAFTAAGYEYVGLDHFALPDDELATARKNRTLQRNFMGYSTRAGHDLVGFGVSSIGEINGCYFQNERTLPEWGERVGRTGHGVLRGHRLSREDRLRRDVIMRVMCHGNLVKSEIEKAHGIRFDEHFARELEDLAPLEGDELLTLDADGLELTRLGQVFMRNIAVVFDLYSRERIEKGGLNDKVFSRTL